MPTTWAFYTRLRFGWSSAMIGASLALAGVFMATSQASLLRLLVPRIGERRVALLGITIASVGFVGFATATASWMMFAWLVTWFFGAMVMPSTNALMSHRVPPDAQGELQGAVAGLFSLASIVGPPLMTQVFGRFSAPSAPVHVPGAAFLVAAGLGMVSFVIYWASTRVSAARPRTSESATEASTSSPGQRSARLD
jgi:DHA1 family tetracycline resistance protein-like MFS transporter